jgi:hypothetical protein
MLPIIAATCHSTMWIFRAEDPRVNNPDLPDQSAARVSHSILSEPGGGCLPYRNWRSRVQPSDDVPTLKRDLFASEEEWQAAQGKVDDLRRGADPLMNRWQRLMP